MYRIVYTQRYTGLMCSSWETLTKLKYLSCLLLMKVRNIAALLVQEGGEKGWEGFKELESYEKHSVICPMMWIRSFSASLKFANLSFFTISNTLLVQPISMIKAASVCKLKGFTLMCIVCTKNMYFCQKQTLEYSHIFYFLLLLQHCHTFIIFIVM